MFNIEYCKLKYIKFSEQNVKQCLIWRRESQSQERYYIQKRETNISIKNKDGNIHK